MAKSRRRPRSTSQQQRKKHNKQAQRLRSSSSTQGISLDPRHPARHLAELLTEEDRRNFELCMDAEALANLDGALDHYLASPSFEGAPQLYDLLHLRALRDDVPPWAWSRWVCRQAHRWLLFEEDPRQRRGPAHAGDGVRRSERIVSR